MKLDFSRGVGVKICGITNRDDALAAVDAGAALLGFNTWTGTPRRIDLARHADWIAALPESVMRVALLVNASHEEIAKISKMDIVDALQFHGNEDAATCRWAVGLGKPIIKAIRGQERGSFEEAGSFSTPHVLLDAHVPGAYGGTGARVDLALVSAFKQQHPNLTLWLAGGLSPENVGAAVSTVRPAVVDVSSGVEFEPGRKDPEKMRRFVRAAKDA